ncbi:hypothetical protein NDU88_005106 [Pleurodeles waltl]|uniref:Uncharacterized protein n=1 Tax=Pleurodeles waltl TaxID=8319 RepID=A0AAV7L253_PLEWA|nr:hypothetical protein NDU88_005106 [Pleurodeles waltl]
MSQEVHPIDLEAAIILVVDGTNTYQEPRTKTLNRNESQRVDCRSPNDPKKPTEKEKALYFMNGRRESIPNMRSDRRKGATAYESFTEFGNINKAQRPGAKTVSRSIEGEKGGHGTV